MRRLKFDPPPHNYNYNCVHMTYMYVRVHDIHVCTLTYIHVCVATCHECVHT